MGQLTDKQNVLIFDFAMGSATEAQIAEAKELIAANEQASKIYSELKVTFSILSNLEPEACPDELVESTVLRLKNAARASHLHLEQLLADEQKQKIPSRRNIWINIGKRLATAAVFVFVGSILITATNFAQQTYRNFQCQNQQAGIFRGISNYGSDHDGQMPAVAMAAGAPWWKVGYQGNENHSNTRHMWQLVKKGYVNPNDFVCPALKGNKIEPFDIKDVKKYNDFPGRKNVLYSFRIVCNKPMKISRIGSTILMSDMNPLFQNLPKDFGKMMVVELDERKARLNSPNHGGRGQNVLFGDGSVIFLKQRRIGAENDDIFTLQDKEVYKGDEVPSCEKDVFLAP